MSDRDARRRYLRTPAAIRERAEKMLKYVEDGRSAWFALDADGLEAAVQATLAVTRQRFPNPSTFPSIRAGGISRPAAATAGRRWPSA